jgi:archaellum component FlaC
MQNRWIFGALAVLSALLAVAFVGCGDDDETPQEAESQVCTDLGDLATAIEGVQDLTADSTVAEAQSAVEAVQSAWDDVTSSAQGLAQAEEDALQSAVDDLQSSIQDVSGSDTVSEALADIQSSADEVESTRAETSSSLNCSSPGT